VLDCTQRAQLMQVLCMCCLVDRLIHLMVRHVSSAQNEYNSPASAARLAGVVWMVHRQGGAVGCAQQWSMPFLHP
jgi:hypothetical protein